MLENADQKKLSIRTLFTRCLLFALDNEDMIETYLLLIRLQLNSWSVSIAQIVQESLQGTKGRQVHLYRVDKYIFLKKVLLILLRNTFTKGDRVKSFLPVHWIKKQGAACNQTLHQKVQNAFYNNTQNVLFVDPRDWFTPFMKFSQKISLVNVTKPHFLADFFMFNETVIHENLHLLCNVINLLN